MKIFKHLEDTNEDYFTHMQQSLSISLKMFKGSFYAFTHAFIPNLFEKNASNICRDIVENVSKRTNA